MVAPGQDTAMGPDRSVWSTLATASKNWAEASWGQLAKSPAPAKTSRRKTLAEKHKQDHLQSWLTRKVKQLVVQMKSGKMVFGFSDPAQMVRALMYVGLIVALIFAGTIGCILQAGESPTHSKTLETSVTSAQAAALKLADGRLSLQRIIDGANARVPKQDVVDALGGVARSLEDRSWPTERLAEALKVYEGDADPQKYRGVRRLLEEEARLQVAVRGEKAPLYPYKEERALTAFLVAHEGDPEVVAAREHLKSVMAHLEESCKDDASSTVTTASDGVPSESSTSVCTPRGACPATDSADSMRSPGY